MTAISIKDLYWCNTRFHCACHSQYRNLVYYPAYTSGHLEKAWKGIAPTFPRSAFIPVHRTGQRDMHKQPDLPHNEIAPQLILFCTNALPNNFTLSLKVPYAYIVVIIA